MATTTRRRRPVPTPVATPAVEPPGHLLPHQRDQLPGATDGIVSVPMQQAFRDLSRGLVDTDRGVEADRAYRKLKRD